MTDSRAVNGEIFRARKSDYTQSISESDVLVATDVALQRVLPSECKVADWGVCMFKATCGGLRLPLAPGSWRQKRLLTVCAHFLNFGTRVAGLN